MTSRDCVIATHKQAGFLAGVCSMNGHRADFEDTHVITDDFVAIFDGHLGTETSQYLKENYRKFLLGRTILEGVKKTSQDLITQACLNIDEEIKTKLKTDSGSTGILAYFDYNGFTCNYCKKKLQFFGDSCNTEKCRNNDENESYSSSEDEEKSPSKYERDVLVANIGDSRCIVIHANGTFTSLSDDHKPLNPIEKKRIETAGSYISYDGRVDSRLNVSRSFGDFYHKDKMGFKPENQPICVVPDFKQIRLKSSDLLLICCDGIMETFDREYVVKFVNETLGKDPSMDLGKLSKKVCLKAINERSHDNLTCIFIRFNVDAMYKTTSIEIKKKFTECDENQWTVFNQNANELQSIVDAIQANPPKKIKI